VKFTRMLYYDIKKYFYKKTDLILFTTVPLITILLFSYAFSIGFFNKKNIEPFNIAVVNKDKTFETQFILKHLEESEAVHGLIKIMYASYDEALNMLKNGEVAAVMIIPENLSQNVDNEVLSEIKVLESGSYPFQASIIKEILSKGIGLINSANTVLNTMWGILGESGLEREYLVELYDEMSVNFYLNILSRHRILSQKGFVSSMEGFIPIEYYGISIVVIFIMLNSMFTIRTVRNDIENNTLGRLVQNGATPLKYIMVKYVSSMAVTLFQYILPGIVIIVLTSGHLKEIFFNTAVSFIVISMCSCSIMLIIVMISGNTETAAGNGFLVTVLMAFTGGAILPLPYLPKFIRVIADISPCRWAIVSFLNSIYEGDISLIYKAWLILLIMTGILMVLSVILFMKKTEGKWVFGK